MRTLAIMLFIAFAPIPAAAQQPPDSGLVLRNPTEVGRLLTAGMPRHLRRAAGGASAVVQVMVGDTGAVDSLRIRVSSGSLALDSVAREAAGHAWFAPRVRGAADTVWTEMHLEFDDALSGSVPRPWAVGATNRDAVRDTLQSLYPPLLRESRITAQAEVFVTVGVDGRVELAEVAQASCFPDVDDSVLGAARSLVFAPAEAAVARRALLSVTFSRYSARLLMTGDTIPPREPREWPEPEGDGETRAPVLTNRSAVASKLERAHPRRLLEAGISGTPVVRLFISDTGGILEIQLHRSGGLCEMDRAALEVAKTMKFRPALNRGTAVAVWVEIPLIFNARR